MLAFIEGNPEKEVLLVEAPTGTGKSPVCMTVANDGSGVILTPQKILQDQYHRDWPTVPVVKGMANYRCSRYSSVPVAEEGYPYEQTCEANAPLCRSAQNGSCTYKQAAMEFYSARVGITNYAFLFNLLSHNFEEAKEKIGTRWLLFDEGHELESQLITAAEVVLSEDALDRINLSPPIPGVMTIPAVTAFLNLVVAALVAQVKTLREDLGLSEVSAPSFLQEDFSASSAVRGEAQTAAKVKQLSQATLLLTRCRNMAFALERGVEWVSSSTGKEFVSRPLWVDGLFNDFIRPLGKKILITSATMVPHSLMARWFGWAEDTYAYMGVDSPFPVNNRPVYFKPVAWLSKANLDDSLPKVVAFIDKICRKYPNVKGVIHCHSFDLGEKIMKLSTELPARASHHRHGMDRDKVLLQHCSATYPSVLLSPSMTEGIDLKDDLARFVIIPKMPYPSLGDPWVKRRLECDSDWYNFQVVKAVVQGCGRAVRHVNDRADSYILDGNFNRLLDEYSYCFPDWFLKALCKVK